MCILCGELIMQDHWTDKRISSDNEPTITVGETQGIRRRNRLHRVRLANKILPHYGLNLTEWNGSKFILKNKKGKIETVHDLGALWPAVEKINNCPIDPLDPALLEKIKHYEDEQVSL